MLAGPRVDVAGAARPRTSAAVVQAIRQGRDSARSGICPSGDATDVRIGDYRRRITRAEFEALDRARSSSARSAPCRQALADAGLEPSQIDEVVLVGGSTRIPLVRRLVGELFGRTPHTELNPDEVVALGAAVQADILVTGNREMLLLDVTPLSLGIETMGGVMSKIILRNSTIPATGSEMFTTGVDNQTAVDIHVLQGERELVADNRSLARFKLRGIPPMPAGLPRVQVQFQIDANGILSVTATRAAHRHRADDRGEAVVRAHRRGGRADAARLVRARRGRLRRAAAHRGAERGRVGRSRATEKSLRAPEFADDRRRPSSRRASRSASSRRWPALKHVLDVVGSRRRSSNGRTRSTTPRSTWPK